MFISSLNQIAQAVTAFGAAAAPTILDNPGVLIAVLFGLGATFGFLLAFADKKIAVKLNPLIHVVEEELPKGQCGACGFPGCSQYAENVVEDPDVSPTLCVPGGDGVAKLIADLTGKVAKKTEPKIAQVLCRGDAEIAVMRHLYDGVEDCLAADLFFGSGKACEYGCIGFGNCIKVCAFDAIHMGANGLPIIDKDKCTGCGACAEECPRDVIELIPKSAKVVVYCRSHEKAGTVKKQCRAGCLGCGLCAKFCDEKAIRMDRFLPEINHAVCVECDNPTCLTEKCKTQAIAKLWD